MIQKLLRKLLRKLLIVAPIILLVTACGLLNTKNLPPEKQSFSFNGVKLIQPGIFDGGTSTTMQQPAYDISDQSRLLLRFEDFLSKIDTVSINNKVKVELTLASLTDVNAAKTNFILCPVLTNWMMLATWYKAYPMGTSGVWQSQGGDFDHDTCVTVSAVTDQTLQFDVTDWVLNYVLGRHLNYGLILYSKSPSLIQIDGDTSGAFSPRIEWLKN